LTVRRITPEEAAQRLAGVAARDPSGLTPNDDALARMGLAYSIDCAAGSAVFVIAQRNGCAFVTAAQGSGDVDMTALLDHVVTLGATNDGCKAIAFQTARPGLVRKLTRRGFKVTGWVLRKEL
jgi:hypothetical protein